MRVYRCVIGCCMIVFLLSGAKGQSYIRFVENKGQWDKNVAFKGELTNGAMILKPDGGYRMVMNNAADIDAVGKYYHGQGSNSAKTTSSVVSKSAVADPTGSFTGSGGASNGGNPGGSPEPVFTIHSHAYEVRFLNANPNPVAVPDKVQREHNNYFIGNDPSKWTSDCKVFQAVTFQNIYPNIDIHYYTSNGQLKYDLVVWPGGNPDNIAMYYEGPDELKLKDGALVIRTSIRDVTELAPYSYLLGDAGRRDVPCSYDVKGSIVRFKLNNTYSGTGTLVIDPQLVFSTFSGSTADNWGYTATYDGQGNFYSGGIVFGAGLPATNGAFQTTFMGGNKGTGEGGGFDIDIEKFNPDGSALLYATYLGGSGNEQPHSLVVDHDGNLIVAGRTSSPDYPVFPANNTRGPGGGLDIILTKFNATGSALLGSVVIGGKGDDGVNIRGKYLQPYGPESINRNYGDDGRSEVIVDGSNNIYLASCTQSTDFPVVNAAQPTNGGANGSGRSQDAVVIKMNPTLTQMLFGTYLGGNDDDAAYVISINPITNNIYVGGGTASSNFPGNKSGVLFPSFLGGICDGFVAVLSNDGSQLIRSSYFGTNGTENVYGVQSDKNGDLYIMGTTTGTWPVINAVFSQAGGKQFIAKLKPDLSAFIYSTTFGSANAAQPNISPTAFLVDRCQNVYVSGWGGEINEGANFIWPSEGTNGLSTVNPINAGGTDGHDFYFFVLEKNALSQLYGDFFGQKGGNFQDHVDGGTSRFDPNGVIYEAICANCGGPAGIFPITPGVVFPNNNSGLGCNLASLKIALNLSGVSAGLQSAINGRIRDTSGCMPLTVSFTDTIGSAKRYIWDFGDNSPQVITTVPTSSHTFTKLGVFRVMEVAIDSSTCNIADTSYLNIRVRNDSAVLVMTASKLPPCTSLDYQFNNNSIAPPGKPFSSTSFQLAFGDGTNQLVGAPQVINHTYPAIGTYKVDLLLLDTNYCNSSDSLPVTVRLAANLKAQFATPPAGCAPYTAVFINTSVGGQTFTWDFGDGTTSSAATPPPHLYANSGTYVVTLSAADPSTCNGTDKTSFTITVSGKPTSSFTYLPKPPKANTPVDFTNTSAGGSSYKWTFGDGDTLVTTSLTDPASHIYQATESFNACLIAYTVGGCTDTSCQAVQAQIIPLYDVPNAFTPNGDGKNDKIYVKGYGITRMEWQIYNRWGTLVFISTDPAIGWDGTYQGVLQPQEVYHYVLSIEFSNKTKDFKKGDITLLR